MEESHWNKDGTYTHCCNCNHTHNPTKMTIKIPIEKIPKWWEFWHWGKRKISVKQAKKSLSELMSLYKGDILLDETIDTRLDKKKEDK